MFQKILHSITALSRFYKAEERHALILDRTMHIAIIFINIGNYHRARLTATYHACEALGWQLTAIQLTDDCLEHPWGEFANATPFPVKTLMPVASTTHNPQNVSAPIAGQLLVQSLNDLKPDVVFFPGWSFSSFIPAGLRWCRTANAVPILMSETQENDAPRRWWRELYKRWRIRPYRAALVGGQPHQRYLMKLGMAADAIFFGYDVVGNHYFHPAQIQTTPNPIGTPYFLSINRFIPKKNLLFLLAAYKAYYRLAGDHPWHLVLCGDGELRPQIEHYIQEAGLNSVVHLPGFLPQDRLLPYYAHAGCFVHASVQEQWGLVVNEAMAAGLPVLVSDHCGCAEDLVLEGVNGFRFDPEDNQTLTQLMLKFSSGTLNLNAMGAASLHHIQSFSPDRFAQGVVRAVQYSHR